MANYVYTRMGIKGSIENLNAFAEKAKEAHKSYYTNFDGKVVEATSQGVLKFWNFISPAPEAQGTYFAYSSVQPANYAEMTFEERVMNSMTFATDGWYDWNIRNWGCKWDASETDVQPIHQIGDTYGLDYSFETAWAIPEGALTAMVEQHPELEFNIWCEEEQGWGATFTGSEGVFTLTQEWDIPNSHADWVSLGDEERCSCNFDQDDRFSDCPNPEDVLA